MHNKEEDILFKKLITQNNCPICFSKKIKKIATSKTIHPLSNKCVDLLMCAKCKHWWHSPMPNQKQLNSFYKNESEYVVPKTYTEDVSRSQNDNTPLFEKIYKDIAYFSQKILSSHNFSYLEIGVGSGALFTFFANKASLAYGVEPGKWVTEKNNTIVSDISDIPNNMQFDVIVAHDVLEHV